MELLDLVPDHLRGGLSPAEERLLRLEGTQHLKASDLDDVFKMPSVEEAREWGSERQIRGELASWLLSDARAAEIVPPGGITLADVMISGSLTISRCPFPLHFHRAVVPILWMFSADLCSFTAMATQFMYVWCAQATIKQDFHLSYCHVSGGLALAGSRVGGGVSIYATTIEPPPTQDAAALEMSGIVVDGLVAIGKVSEIRGGIALTKAEIHGSLFIGDGSRVEASPGEPALRFTSASIDGAVHISKCNLAGSLSAPLARIRGGVQVEDVGVTSRTDDAIDFNGSTVNGDMIFERVDCSGHLNLVATTCRSLVLICCALATDEPGHPVLLAERLRLDGDLFCSKSDILGGVLLDLCRVEGACIWTAGRIETKQHNRSALSMTAAQIAGGLVLRGKLTVVGGVSLEGLSSEGRLQLDDVHVIAGPDDGVAMNVGNVRIRDLAVSKVVAEGQLMLLGCRVSGLMFFREARITNESGVSVNLCRAHVANDIYLFEVDFQNGLDLSNASIKGSFLMTDGRVGSWEQSAINASGARIDDDLRLLKGVNVAGQISLRDAKIARNLEFEGCRVFSEPAHGFDGRRMEVRGALMWNPRTPVRGTVDLRGAKVGYLSDNLGAWPPAGQLRIESFSYGWILGDGSEALDPALRLKWVKKDRGSGSRRERFVPHPYEQLADVLQASGREVAARDVRIAKEKARRKHGQISVMQWLWLVLYGATVSYGWRPGRALYIAVLVCVLGWAGFSWSYHEGAFVPTRRTWFPLQPQTSTVPPTGPATPWGEWGSALHEVACGPEVGSTPPSVRSGRRPLDYPEFCAAAYAVDAFVPFVDLHQEAFWLPDVDRGWPGQCAWVFLWLDTAFGWVICSILAYALAGLARRGSP